MTTRETPSKWTVSRLDRRESPHVGKIAARVPGDIHADLARAGIIGDPLRGDAARDLGWVARARWEYHCAVVQPRKARGGLLRFLGVDGDARILVDGAAPAASVNAHREVRLELAGSATPSARRRTILVQLDSGLPRAVDADVSRYIPTSHIERIWTRKPQYVFGWDWAPRLVSVGLWRPVELLWWRDAALITARARGAADGAVTVRAEVIGDGATTLEVAILASDGGCVAHTSGAAAPGLNERALVIDRPRRWSAGGATQPYEAHLTLRAGDRVIDSRRVAFDCVDISLDRSPDSGGSAFRFVVNGEPLFARGANWVPPYHLPGEVADETVSDRVRRAADAGMNMLRVWGGGVYESDHFYRECARRGILVWQDFAFACAEYPEDDEAFRRECEAEARDNLSRLWGHANLALVCGNNENHWMYGTYARGDASAPARFYGSDLSDEILPRIARNLVPQVEYWNGSPWGGVFPNSAEEGDVHAWEVSIHHPDILRRADPDGYHLDTGRFVSEYGMCSAAFPAAVVRFSGAASLEEVDFGSYAYRSHDNEFNEAGAAGRSLTEWNVRTLFGRFPARPVDAARYRRFAARSLYAQAWGLREAATVHRSGAGGCEGSLLWMLDDCWGTHSWSIVDSDGRVKPAWWWLRYPFGEPAVLVVIRNKRCQFVMVSDGDLPPDLAVELTAARVDEPAQRGRRETVALKESGRGRHTLATWYDVFGRVGVTLRNSGGILRREVRLTHPPKLLRPPAARLEWSWHDGLLTVRSDCGADAVWIDSDGEVEDNAFGLFPGEERSIIAERRPRAAFSLIDGQPPATW